ncbi:hypothetical protein SDD30_10390 [Moorella naiadis]|uniref:hypothetical protein n=1 Tax=Moorella naiadis (nom. illeg.) TaxID=3093670 RepID=UPI003D9CBD3A
MAREAPAVAINDCVLDLQGSACYNFCKPIYLVKIGAKAGPDWNLPYWIQI